MIAPIRIKILVTLLAVTLLALAACMSFTSSEEGTDLTNQPTPTTSGESLQINRTGQPEPPRQNSQGGTTPQDDSNQADTLGKIEEELKCPEVDPDSMGQSIAETFDVPYEQVIDWFCAGFSFENILLSLETSEAVDIPAETLLEMLLEQEWEEIWEEVGFTTKP
ncbi:MAG: hypothetical protein EHM41_05060 [Chloroflexi bacterium]|nr:MAG: hypothetical protein EHM41_05060 [Chloroflexota bacterium]